MRLIQGLPDEDFKRALDRIKAKTGELWAPSFVLERVKSGNAGLFRFVDESPFAWMVVERYDQGKAWMNVWLMEGSPGPHRTAEMVRLIDELCIRLGCERWRFTGRKGWERALHGYARPVATVYERELI